jgi:hypothetical protein
MALMVSCPHGLHRLADSATLLLLVSGTERCSRQGCTATFMFASPAAPRTHPALSPLRDPSGLDAGLLGLPDRARRHRHVGDRADPPQAGRPQPPAERPSRPLEPPGDWRRHSVSAAQAMGLARGLGVCQRPGRGYHVAVAHAPGFCAPLDHCVESVTYQ